MLAASITEVSKAALNSLPLDYVPTVAATDYTAGNPSRYGRGIRCEAAGTIAVTFLGETGAAGSSRTLVMASGEVIWGVVVSIGAITSGTYQTIM